MLLWNTEICQSNKSGECQNIPNTSVEERMFVNLIILFGFSPVYVVIINWGLGDVGT